MRTSHLGFKSILVYPDLLQKNGAQNLNLPTDSLLTTDEEKQMQRRGKEGSGEEEEKGESTGLEEDAGA
jgi:hypothetical protein